jgi:hypothetical protein
MDILADGTAAGDGIYFQVVYAVLISGFKKSG